MTLHRRVGKKSTKLDPSRRSGKHAERHVVTIHQTVVYPHGPHAQKANRDECVAALDK
jgi:hypothetical protein